MLFCLLVLVGLSRDQPNGEPLAVLGRHRLICPVCRLDFPSLFCAQANARGGIDRDLFARALGPQPEFYRVASCPGCGYSGYETDFDPGVSLPPGFRDRVLEELGRRLPRGFGPDSDPADLDAADRYELAITCYRWRRASDESLAWLHLRASWVAREEGSALPHDSRLARVFKFAERWRPVLAPGDNQADAELRTATYLLEARLAGRFNRYQRPYVDLATALILRRHGENRSAAALLEGLEGLEGFPALLVEGIARMRGSIELERKHQEQAAECFERALLSHEISSENRSAACYVLAELHRRLGREREATGWYAQALDDPGLPDRLRKWASEQQAGQAPARRPEDD